MHKITIFIIVIVICDYHGTVLKWVMYKKDNNHSSVTVVTSYWPDCMIFLFDYIPDCKLNFYHIFLYLKRIVLHSSNGAIYGNRHDMKN